MNSTPLGSVLLPGTYAAQVERALRTDIPRFRAAGEDTAVLEWLASSIPQAQHFVLPDDGKLLDDGLDSITGEPVRLPFPSITLSYPSSHAHPVESAEPGIGVFYPAKRFTFAIETTFATIAGRVVPLPGIRAAVDPGAPCIAIVGANWGREGYWYADPCGFAMYADAPVVADGDPSRVQTVTFHDPRRGIRKVENKTLGGFPFSVCPQILATVLRKHGREGVLSSVYDAAGEATSVLGLVEALACSNVGTEKTDVRPGVNAKRAARGKLPLYAYHTLVVDVPARAQPGQGEGGGHHRSPRQHLRRGHVRRLASGRKTWVSACVVGTADSGVVGKQYAVTTDAGPL